MPYLTDSELEDALDKARDEGSELAMSDPHLHDECNGPCEESHCETCDYSCGYHSKDDASKLDLANERIREAEERAEHLHEALRELAEEAETLYNDLNPVD